MDAAGRRGSAHQPELPRAADPVSSLRDGRGIDGPGGHSRRNRKRSPRCCARRSRPARWASRIPPASSTSATRAVRWLAAWPIATSWAATPGCCANWARASIEVTLTQNFGHIQDHELDLLKFLLDESGRPVTWLAIFDREDQPQASGETLQRAESLIKRGGIPQMTCRPLIAEFSMKDEFRILDDEVLAAGLRPAAREAQADLRRP